MATCFPAREDTHACTHAPYNDNTCCPALQTAAPMPALGALRIRARAASARRRAHAAAAGASRRAALCAAAAAAPADITSDLAACFHSQLAMSNGCIPGSLLLHEVLTARGHSCRLKSGYLLMALPAGGGTGSGPAVLAVAHMWVEAAGPAGAPSRLDIGSAIAAAAGADFSGAELYLSPDVPSCATRADLADPELGAAAAAAEAAMAAMADASAAAATMQEVAGAYWAGAPPALQAFRTAMLARFAGKAGWLRGCGGKEMHLSLRHVPAPLPACAVQFKPTCKWLRGQSSSPLHFKAPISSRAGRSRSRDSSPVAALMLGMRFGACSVTLWRQCRRQHQWRECTEQRTARSAPVAQG